MTIHREVNWIDNPHGEINEVYAIHRFHTLIVFSNEDKSEWFWKIDDNEPRGKCNSRDRAMKAVIDNLEGR